MKILCSKEEFAALVRQCYRSAMDCRCDGCPFSPVCTCGIEQCYENQIMSRIEDICEIEVANG